MTEDQPKETGYRWVILILATLTNALVVAVPSMALPVLFKEISTELHLSLVQVGLVWGVGALPGIATVLLGGAIADRFGPKRVLILGCLLTGLTGASRGLASNFITLAGTMILAGLVSPVLTTNTVKTCGQWFPGRQLGLANGFLSMGMALGFLVGSLFSATVVSPWLGGWRHVLFFYGAIGMVLSIPWFFTRPAPAQPRLLGSELKPVSLRWNLAHVARLRNVWLLGLTILGVGGCIAGTLGYLPLYLRGQGWSPDNADIALSTFHLVSMICVIPIALISDRLRSRKRVLTVAGLTTILGVGLLSFASGPLVWVAVGLAGMARDGFMAVFTTAIIETEGVGTAYAGTATGLVMVFSGLGSLIAPPLGNSLASYSPGSPFIFWAGLTLLGIIAVLASRRRSPSPALALEG